MSDHVTQEDKQQTTESALAASEDISEKEQTTEEFSRKHVDSHDEALEPKPQLHTKTFLAVFAVCLIYFAQDFALVGAGAVSQSILFAIISYNF